jgi:putative transposase
MLRLEKAVRDPENTTLKAPASKNLYNIRVELNPVRAGMIQSPQDYQWSSFAHRVGESFEYPWLTIDPCFQSLGVTDQKRKDRYREYIFSSRPAGEWKLIRDAGQRGLNVGETFGK